MGLSFYFYIQSEFQVMKDHKHIMHCFECNECDDGFETKKNLTNHTLAEHTESASAIVA